MFLGVPFYLFGYKRGCWVTAIDPRLQNLEFGYSYLAVTADCIHKCVIFQVKTSDFLREIAGFSFCQRTGRMESCTTAGSYRPRAIPAAYAAPMPESSCKLGTCTLAPYGIGPPRP